MQGIFVFGVVYFLNPLVVWVQLESRTYRGREGGRMSRVPLQLWREAPGPCSGEVGPVTRLPAGSGEAGSPSVHVSRAEESCHFSDLQPQRLSPRFPNRVPAAEGQDSMGRPDSLLDEEHWPASDAR